MTAMIPKATESKPAPHYHLGGTETNHGTYWSLDEAEAACAQQAVTWLQRYGEANVTVQQGYAAVWRNGIRIDYRTAFACTNPHCVPRATVLPYQAAASRLRTPYRRVA